MDRRNFLKSIPISSAFVFNQFGKTEFEKDNVITLHVKFDIYDKNSFFFSHIEETNKWEVLPIYKIKRSKIIFSYAKRDKEYFTLDYARFLDGEYTLKVVEIKGE